MTTKTVYMSSTPKLHLEDLVKFDGALVCFNTEHKDFRQMLYYEYIWTTPDVLKDKIKGWWRAGDGTKTFYGFFKRFVKLEPQDSFKLNDFLEKINRDLKYEWNYDNVISVEIYLVKREQRNPSPNEVRVYNKRKYHDAKTRLWKNFAKQDVSVKMKSNKMYNKTSSTQKSPVKSMTGDIGQLGKNFRKLI